MKSRQIIIFAVLMIVLTILIGIWGEREPHYRGQPLTYWLEECSDTPLSETQRLNEAQAAVRAMPIGRVLPELLRLAEAGDDPASIWIKKESDQFHLDFLHWRLAEDFQQLGIAGFQVLGTNAASAAPELSRLLNDNAHAFTAVRCLVFLGNSAEVPMGHALTNANVNVRQYSASQLYWVSDDAETFIAQLTNCLNDADGGVRNYAVQGIGAQTALPHIVLPILVRELEKDDGNVSVAAAAALADFGTNALGLFPVLSNFVVHGKPDAATRQMLTTLVAIEPDRALPLVLSGLRSADRYTRHGSFTLLCKYPLTNGAVETEIEGTVTNRDSSLAGMAKAFISKNYNESHSLASQLPGEPSYGNKPLGDWLESWDNESGFSQGAKEAVLHMGTNALPGLLARLTYVKPPFGLPDYKINMEAVRAFILLGELSQPAWPQLMASMESTNEDLALYAMLASCGTGSNAIPFFTKGMTNQSSKVRAEALNCLAELPGIQFLDQRRQAIPLVASRLQDADEEVRESATNALKEIDPKTAAEAGIK